MKQGNLELTLGDKILAILYYGAYACGNVVSLYLYVRYRTIIQTRADFYYTFIYSMPLILMYHIPGFDKLPRVFKYTCNALALLYCAAGGLSVEYIGSDLSGVHLCGVVRLYCAAYSFMCGPHDLLRA